MYEHSDIGSNELKSIFKTDFTFHYLFNSKTSKQFLLNTLNNFDAAEMKHSTCLKCCRNVNMASYEV